MIFDYVLKKFGASDNAIIKSSIPYNRNGIRKSNQ